MAGIYNKLAIAVSAATLGTALAVNVASATSLEERLAARNQAIPQQILDQKLDTPATAKVTAAFIEPALIGATGRQEVIVRLKGDPVAMANPNSRSTPGLHKAQIEASQAEFTKRAMQAAPSCKSMGSTQVVLNAVFMEVDASEVAALSRDSAVASIRRVKNYELDLSETVPYIGASFLQSRGIDGEGIKVAVLDSGIDYTHASLGGGGTLADYEAAYGLSVGDPAQTTRDGLFPTADVVEGFDFVGEAWPDGDLAPDDDPIDLEGHGTHVADIIGGNGGVAPGVDLYAVKVCSAVGSACSGIALIQGVEYSVDPNGDGDTSDRVDIMNMSLGSSYGQAFDDDLATAVDNATALGVLTVASAGNSGDKPYANGTPAGAPTALSVAQTQVPSAELPFLSVAGTDYPGVFQAFSVPPEGLVQGTLQYGDGAGGNLLGCDEFPEGSLDGLAVLVDRGACAFSLKIRNISVAGGSIGIIGLVAPGDPFSGGDSGDRPIDIPGYMISQSDSTALKGLAGETLVVDPANGLQLIGQMVGSSARGPQHEAESIIKPEIGAPGASVSAIAGSGTGTGPFGGTSGAAPMVAGAAALLLQVEPELSPAESKARLMTNAETDIETDPFAGQAPITRIGGGEVRIDEALASKVAAWDESTLQGALSFGYVEVDRSRVRLTKRLVVKNYADLRRTFDVAANFRFPEDEASGAVSVSVTPSRMVLQPNASRTVVVRMTINGDSLPDNFMNSGSDGANPSTLTANEFDGYVTMDDGSSTVEVPWHVLPRKAAKVSAPSQFRLRNGEATVNLRNRGVGVANNDVYALLAVSDNQPEGGQGQQSPTPDIRAVGVNTIPVPAGFCSADESFLWVFAINTWEAQQHLLPVSHIVSLDIDQDGVDDYVILNRDASGLGTITDGRQLAWALDLETGDAGAFFFAEHNTNTGNTALTVCAEQVGLTGADILATNVDVSFEAQDFYFGGPGDIIDDLTITPLGERFLGITDDLPAGERGSVDLLDFGVWPGNTPDLGVLLFTNGDRGPGNRGGATKDSEALILTPR